MILGTFDEEESLSGFLGRKFSGNLGDIELEEKVEYDLNGPHMMTIAGKRGYGKSYTLGVIAEELMKIPEGGSENLTGLVIDSMGIYWSMQVENNEAPFSNWNIKNKGFPITVYYPHGLEERYKDHKKYFHKGFRLYPSELTISDWLFLLDIKDTQAQASELSRIINKAKEEFGDFYSIDDLLKNLKKSEASENVISALKRRLEKAKDWGIFSDKGEKIDELVKSDNFIVLDLSGAGELPWNVRTTLTGLLVRKILSKRSFSRSKEEIEKLENRFDGSHFPLIWLFIDEAHLFAPAQGKTPATEPLVEWVRQGRRPGLSAVLATQQPGALDKRILSQCDSLIVHRITAGQDSKAIESKISEIYGSKSISSYMKGLPKEPGYALIMDDKKEEIVPMKVRPRHSRHAGGSAKLDEYILDEK